MVYIYKAALAVILPTTSIEIVGKRRGGCLILKRFKKNN